MLLGCRAKPSSTPPCQEQRASVAVIDSRLNQPKPSAGRVVLRTRSSVDARTLIWKGVGRLSVMVDGGVVNIDATAAMPARHEACRGTFSCMPKKPEPEQEIDQLLREVRLACERTAQLIQRIRERWPRKLLGHAEPAGSSASPTPDEPET
jgi:hypothetical protein